MTSVYGVYQYFDYDSWQRERCTNEKKDKFVYEPGTMMDVIVKNFPRMSEIITRAKYDRRFADPSCRFTFFLESRYEKYGAAEIQQLDVNDAHNIVVSNTIQGRIRKMDLMTSKDSLLNSIQDGTLIHVWHDIRDDRLKKDSSPIVKEMQCTNGILFIL